MKTYLVKNISEMETVAQDFKLILKKGAEATVVGLYGDLGAGKTTFTQCLAKVLGIEESVVSPTFVIEKIYELGSAGTPFSRLIHIDAYRLERAEELVKLGWKNIISDPDNLILIEWPERVEEIMPQHIRIKFEHVSEEERKVEIAEV